MKHMMTLLGIPVLAAIFFCGGCTKSEHVITADDFPKLVTSEVTGIMRNSASCGGRISHQGISLVRARGLCYDTVQNPSLTGKHVVAGDGGGQFYVHLSDLPQNTTYYVRAFATNDAGTSYGDEKSFRTLWDSGYATVSTNLSTYSFSWMEIGGNVSDDGGSPVTEYGICWGTSPLPATGGIKVICGSGTGQFSTVIHGLMMNIPYYARAYAINARGTSCGEQKLIRTINYPFLNVPGSFQGWDPADSSTIIAAVKLDGLYEGYFWFPANTEFKYAAGSGTTTWGDNNHDGTLEPGGANIIAAAEGYYKLNVDYQGLTHSFLKTEWGVTGTATVNGSGSDTDLSYDFSAKNWSVATNLLAGELKFRANHSWDLYYGDDDADGFLEAGGSSIRVKEPGLYTITLDFNKPVYRYFLVRN